MTDRYRDSLDLRDEDRLPWLEAVEDDDDRQGVSPFKVAIAVIAGLALLALVVGGIYWAQRDETPAVGEGALIAAPEGDYKVKPDDPGGMDVQGKGDAAFAASAGAAPSGSIDLNAVPEAPVTAIAPKAPPPPVVRAGRSATAEVADSGGMLTRAPTNAAPRRSWNAGASGSVIQLGAFDSESVANEAWKKLSSRFGFLGNLDKQIMAATVGGRTYYRLRVDSGSPEAAADFCGRMKVGGENCLVVAQ
jgi:hypothetical protein